MNQIEHRINQRPEALSQGSNYYYLDFQDYIRFVRNSNRYVTDGNLVLYDFVASVRRYTRFRSFPYRYVSLHVVNLLLALAWINRYLDTNHEPALGCAERIVRDIYQKYAFHTEGQLSLRHQFPHPAYGLRAGWLSGMAQGLFASASFRLSRLLRDDYFLELAVDAIRTMEAPVGSGGARSRLGSAVWYEEYAGSLLRSHVLNGHMFSLFAVVDAERYQLTTLTVGAADRIRQLAHVADQFIAPSYSLYDNFGTVADDSYNRLHAMQFQLLGRLGNVDHLIDLSEICERFDYERAIILPCHKAKRFLIRGAFATGYAVGVIQ